MIINKSYYFDLVKRHAIWLILLISAFIVFKPQSEEIITVLFVVTVELIAIAMSGIASFIYTRIDFPSHSPIVLGFIFLGVHICAGLTILGVYLAQFG